VEKKGGDKVDRQSFTDAVLKLLMSREPDAGKSFVVVLKNNAEIHTDYFEFEEDKEPVKWVRFYITDLHKPEDAKRLIYPIAVVKLEDIDTILDHSNWC